MDWKNELFNENEKPLDRLVDGYSNTSIFRSVAFIGDSLSSGEMETRDAEGNKGYHDLYEYSWGQFIARKNGFKAYNFSKGGMTARGYLEIFAEREGLWDKEKACQAYVIALGYNDLYIRNFEIGDISDIDDNDWRGYKPTFTGCYGAIVQRYKEISPDAKFFFVTLPVSEFEQRHEITLEMRERMYALAEHFDNAYVIDLYEYAPPFDAEFKKKFNLYGHLNPMGYLFVARIIDSYIDYIIRHNIGDFRKVGLIGTDIKCI